MRLSQLFFRTATVVTMVVAFTTYASAQGGFLDGLRGQVERELGGAAQELRSQLQREIRPAPPLPPDSPRSFGGVPGESGRVNRPGENFNPQPGFGQPNYGQPNYGQPNYGQPNYGQPRPGQPDYRPPGVGQPTYAEPPTRAESFNGQSITVRSPKANPGDIQYELLVSGQAYPYSMGPGERQAFNETHLWLIRYQSGGTQKTYRLRGGRTYEFELDAQGRVQLYRLAHSHQEPPLRQ
ncbi:MAG: hypothetical protein KDA45_14065 [Planctomycetales bacterium]|nr:hypothetical protein [Planctomycetales bacterium]